MEKLKRVVLDGDVVILRTRNNATGLLEAIVFVRDENELEGNNIWKQLPSYRHFTEMYEKTTFCPKCGTPWIAHDINSEDPCGSASV